MSDQHECAICGREGWDVYPGLVRWTSGGVESVERCIDRAACRQRVIENDGVWQVNDPTDKLAEPKGQRSEPVRDHIREYAEWAAKQPPGQLERSRPMAGAATPGPTPTPAARPLPPSREDEAYAAGRLAGYEEALDDDEPVTSWW